MKKMKLYITALFGLLIADSCKLDNYAGPNAVFYGSIMDSQTNERIEQDIINGAQIEYIEQGYENPQNQYIRIKNDGTFRNNLMFEGSYIVKPVRGNFVPVEPKQIQIKGELKMDFLVQPYIRVKDAVIKKTGNKIIATFKIQQTVSNTVKKIGLYAHPGPSVGEPMRIVASERVINAVTNANTVYTLEIDLTSNSSALKPGNQYFFRVGALINAPEAKFNYAPAVRIAI